MTGSRRFSQAISEGDGISLLAEVVDADAARDAEAGGAEGIVVRMAAAGLRDATELPILWTGATSADEACRAGADALLLAVEGLESENGALERLHDEANGRGLECVIVVRDEDELRLALDRLDPEIVLLTGGGTDPDDALEHVLSLLPDVPAGKLAVAELDLRGRDDVSELERAGVDAVVVPAGDVVALIGDLHPQP